MEGVFFWSEKKNTRFSSLKKTMLTLFRSKGSVEWCLVPGSDHVDMVSWKWRDICYVGKGKYLLKKSVKISYIRKVYLEPLYCKSYGKDDIGTWITEWRVVY